MSDPDPARSSPYEPEPALPPLGRVPRLEAVAVLALAGHGAFVLAAVGGGTALQWTVVGLVALAAVAGLVRPAPGQSAARGLGVVLGAVLCQIAGNEPASYFLLWLFVVAAVYPLALGGAAGRIAALVPAAGFLLVVPFDPLDGPLVLAVPRLLALLVVAGIAHAATEAHAATVERQGDAVAVLDTYFDTAPVAVGLLDRERRFAKVNPALAAMNGRSVAEHLGRTVEQVIPGLAPQIVERLGEVLETERAQTGVEIVGETAAAPGEERHWEASFYPVHGRTGLIGVGVAVSEVTERRETEARLAWSATHDALTGLPGRGLFEDRLATALARHARGDGRVAVLYLDLDGFKAVNDTLGHHAGDELLRHVAAVLPGAVRPGDTVARLGGDEFGLLCEGLEDEHAATGLAARVLAAVTADRVRVHGRELTLTPSIGVAVAAIGERDAQVALRAADAAMYHAKQSGRARWALFDDGMRTRMLDQEATERELRELLDAEGLCVAYQPVLALDGGDGSDGAGGRIVAIEALARWHRRDGTEADPASFVALAGRSALIAALGRQVLGPACREAASWGEGVDPAPALAVNLSAAQLAIPTLYRDLRDALESAGLAPERLWVEVSEASLLHDPAVSERAVTAICDLGARVVLDDFGTGHASISQLRRLPVDVVKIDASVVAGLPDDRADRGTVAAIVALSRAVGARTVAEGVETEAQLAAVSELGCDAAQGFLLGRPTAHAPAGRLAAAPVV